MKEPTLNNEKRPLSLILMAVIAIIFGIVTIKEGGTVLFTQQGRVSAGHYVPFVLWFNFLAGFAYVLAGVALLRLKTCSKRLSAVIALSTIVVFIFFGIHIWGGGAYELRTIVAMTIRSVLWVFIAITLRRLEVLKENNCQCQTGH